MAYEKCSHRTLAHGMDESDVVFIIKSMNHVFDSEVGIFIKFESDFLECNKIKKVILFKEDMKYQTRLHSLSPLHRDPWS